jgi:hypothetical protein
MIVSSAFVSIFGLNQFVLRLKEGPGSLRGAGRSLNMMRTDIFEMDSLAPSIDDYFL